LNIHEYISSGILEAYALGSLSDQERAEVEANLSRYPELKAELQTIEEAQEAFLLRSAITPPGRVKERIMREIDFPSPTAMAETHTTTQEARVVPISDESVKWWKAATAASIAIAVLASYLAFNYKGELNQTRERLDNLIAQNQQMAQDYNIVNQRLDQIENTIKIIDNPSYKRVIMKGTEAAPNALASIYWNESSSEVYLSIQQLRDLSQDQQFQLWAIVDGKPVDAGIFNTTAGLIKMKDIHRASAFAVTIEPKGGSASPTLSSMQVIGTI
jgi:anti-sigma-K factor RskA